MGFVTVHSQVPLAHAAKAVNVGRTEVVKHDLVTKLAVYLVVQGIGLYGCHELQAAEAIEARDLEAYSG